MRWSQYFIPTLREDPADAEVVSHRLLLRAGYIRQLGAGIYSFLPLGWRVAQRAMKIIREEMDAVGGQEFFLPALHPSEVWKASGRWAAMGGSESNEFMARTNAGEDFIAVCNSCDYAGNLEKATSRLPSIEDESGPDAPEEFPTPGVRTIEDLTTFPGGASAERQIKTLVFMADRLVFEAGNLESRPQPVLILLRGDHQLQETKLADVLGAILANTFGPISVRPAHPEEIKELLGASPGSLGAVGAKEKAKTTLEIKDFVTNQVVKKLPLDLLIVADRALEGRRNMTTGANKDDFHIRGVDIERDIKPDRWVD